MPSASPASQRRFLYSSTRSLNDPGTETDPDTLPPAPHANGRTTQHSYTPTRPRRKQRVDSGASYRDASDGIEEEDEDEFDAGGATTQGEMDPQSDYGRSHAPPHPKDLPLVPKPPSRPASSARRANQVSTPVPTPPSSTTPLTSLYLVAGLPKSPHTWTLAEPDSVEGCRHAEGAVARWWRAEVLGSTVSPGVAGVGGGKGRMRRGRGEGVDAQRMLAKALKLSFPKEVEIIASTLQPASTVHTFTFTLRPGPASQSHYPQPYTARPSLLSGLSTASSLPSMRNAAHHNPHHANQSTASFHSHHPPVTPQGNNSSKKANGAEDDGTPYYGTVLTVYSHADAARADAIRRALATPQPPTPTTPRRAGRMPPPGGRRRRAPWATSTSTPEATETEGEGLEETDGEGLLDGKAVGGSTLFLPRETVFWLPYALTLVSKHPIYDLMRDFLTLSWARFSKDVQSHSLQIAKILEHPCPRSGDIVKLDAGAEGESVEVVCRFPGGLDFGRGLVDVNFTMWPLFRALNLDNILTICEIALAPTGRVLFLSRYPAMLGIAVHTIKYIVELRGWSGLAHPAVHARDAKIYLEDPGPWLIGLHTDCRFVARPSREVCVCDLDINSVSCATPPQGAVSTKAQRDRFRRTLMAAFEGYFHPDYSVPSEFKEAFPAGRFRPLCSIKTRRGAPSAVYAEVIPPPEWWFQPRVLQAFDAVLKDKYKKPSLLKRLTMIGINKRQAQLTAAEQLIQRAIRRRATAFVDARDDLETKIGRLSRRLNFLITESDLWREKFVAFEGYAEKLSAEAGELRAKIGKEQRESRRLSGLITVTAQEKAQLASKLSQVENEHRDAQSELEQMRLNMEAMEREREQMVAEVEEQIERALASMSFDASLSDGSRPQTPRSVSSSGSSPRMRSFGTATTLAERDMEMVEEEIGAGGGELEVGKRKLERIEETADGDADMDERGREQEQRALDKEREKRKKRFSAGREHGFEDVDAGIMEQSGRMTAKVNQIQHKLEMALADLEHKRRISSPRSSLDDGSADTDHTAHGHASHHHSRKGRVHSPVTPRMASPHMTPGRVVSPLVAAEDHQQHDADEQEVEGRQTRRASDGTLHERPVVNERTVPQETTTVTHSRPVSQAMSAEHLSSRPVSTVSTERPTSQAIAVDIPSSSSTITAIPNTTVTSPRSKRASRMTMMSTTDGGDSDTDFQSAYSSSPVDKLLLEDGEDEEAHVPGSWDDETTAVDLHGHNHTIHQQQQHNYHQQVPFSASSEKISALAELDDDEPLAPPQRPFTRERTLSTETAVGKPVLNS